jgi:hypothetical protein
MTEAGVTQTDSKAFEDEDEDEDEVEGQTA